MMSKKYSALIFLIRHPKIILLQPAHLFAISF